MERFICIHGHFYQPPRENPWLEAIEIQDSAYPYHDWNERITMECYAPNSASRILDGDGHITNIASNYAKISFNFGPTLLSWLEKYASAIYHAILDADRESMKTRSGHGNAIAQIYNHIIMPLGNLHDKRTQIVWGIKDFEYRFKRFPEGMWLSETAVDHETLDILAEQGIKFTVLAPHQAAKVRKIGSGKWKDVSDSKIDPTRAYICKLPSGRRINLFFYDGPISRAVAFDDILGKGERFADRLLTGYSETRTWPQLLNIATDGETYGHHHKFADMALAYALNYIESTGLAQLTNYGEYLEKYPPNHEVQIHDNTSWSCAHGIERWKNDCGCNSGNSHGWNQKWREPLRETFDWLRDELAIRYGETAKKYLKDPWIARDRYIDIVLDRSEENIGRYFEQNALRRLERNEEILVLKLLETQRHTMLMYTSCGWFFDELSGIETVQVIQYAGRALQLAEALFGDNLENVFLDRMATVKSNLPEHKDGSHIYEKFVTPSMIDLKKVGVHYTISSLFDEYADKTTIYTYSVIKKEYHFLEAGIAKLALGKIAVASEITWESELLSFCVLSLGNQVLNGGVRTFLGDEAYQTMKDEICNALDKCEFADIVRMMDKHFGMHNYSFLNLFRDQQRKILGFVIGKAMEDFGRTYRVMYEQNRGIMGFLQETGMPIPKVFKSIVGFLLNFSIKKLCLKDEINGEAIENILSDMERWNVKPDSIELEFNVRYKLQEIMDKFYQNPSDLSLLMEIKKILELAQTIPMELNLWQTQNVYYQMAGTTYGTFLMKAKEGEPEAMGWIDAFKQIGQMLFFDLSAVLPEG